LTHEVENQGAGTVMQQAEVQEVTFNAGLGVAGEATLTYTDLYGQDWTTRPFAVGGENHFVLEYAHAPSGTTAGAVTLDMDKLDLVITYGGTADSTHGVIDAAAVSVDTIRNALLTNAKIYKPANRANNGRSVYVSERPHPTSIKLNGEIYPGARRIFDIYITPEQVDGMDENGGLLEFKSFFGEGSTTEVTTMVTADLGYTVITSAADHSADIQNALESLPNRVIPSVTVTKEATTSPNTAVLGAYGNAFKQTYRITFSDSANSGDQHALACDATACDHDGCANRKVGVADVKYTHFSDETHPWKKANFQGAGYFVISIHSSTPQASADGQFSSGMAWLKWNTGSGVEKADFALIADAAAVQTALRTITGWEAVTVASTVAVGTRSLTAAHAFTVTFPAGYDDGGQIPTVGVYPTGTYTLGGTATAHAIEIVDQRFSNTLWLGRITGWHGFTTSTTSSAGDTVTAGGSLGKFEVGDHIKFTQVDYGHGTGTMAAAAIANSGECQVKTSAAGFACRTAIQSANGQIFGKIDYTQDRPTQTSQQTEDYFAVGSTIEVLDHTWVDTTLTSTVAATSIKNEYRKFKVLGHVKNQHGKMFAKLDGTPETDSTTDYNFRVTSNNGTQSQFNNVRVVASASEVQTIKQIQVVAADGANNAIGYPLNPVTAETFRLYINKNKANEEFTEVLTHGSSNAEVAEAINAFAALSGPVKVDNTLHGYTVSAKVITFDAIDGDVPQLEFVAVGTSTGTVYTTTVSDGSSITGGADARFENMEPGGTINVTSAETVKFVFTGLSATTNNVVTFSYDGIMQSGTAVTLDDTAGLADGAAGGVDTALATILDDNGNAVIGAKTVITGAYTHADNTVTITLPKGMSGSKLEMHVLSTGDHTSTTKTVERNNNGKTFKIVRVDHARTDLGAPGATSAFDVEGVAHATAPVYENEILDFRIGDVFDVTDCSDAAFVTPTTAALTNLAGTAPAVTLTIGTTLPASGAACKLHLVKDTLVLDSVPDAWTGVVDITYTAPSGSCSVSEVTKGTSESATCSNRGACDGGSGLCTCHEGYSGEACETQTVLV